MQSGVGFLAWGGCNGFKSDDPVGAPGTWYRYFNGSFSEPGVGGKQSCLPGIPGGDGGASCPIVHWNTGLQVCVCVCMYVCTLWTLAVTLRRASQLYVMLYQLWGQWDTVLLSTSADGVSWGTTATLTTISGNRTVAYPQVTGLTSSSVAGLVATLTYAADPPTGPYARDFVARSIQFTP